MHADIFHFHPVGLWSYDGPLAFYAPQNRAHASYSALNLQQTEESIYCDVKRLSSLMSRLGHTRLDLLKMDIEGGEDEFLSSQDFLSWLKVQQISLLVELHDIKPNLSAFPWAKASMLDPSHLFIDAR